jgi:HAD superfamily hydrolase (TIGR01509 family)
LSWDALLFDFDGVLADTERVHHACWCEVLKPLGVTFDWEFYRRECVGISDRTLAERFGAGQPECQRKQALFRLRLEQSPPFHSDTLELIGELQACYTLAIVSSSNRLEVEPAVERAGIRPCFQTIVCAQDVERLKPAPDPYLRAAALLSARNPLVIEDSDAGVASAQAAGFEVLRVSAPEAMPRELRDLLGFR